jgi:hypothetical protein
MERDIDFLLRKVGGCLQVLRLAYVIGRTRGKYNRLANYRLFTIDGDKYNSDWLTVKELHNVSLYQTLRSYSTLSIIYAINVECLHMVLLLTLRKL